MTIAIIGYGRMGKEIELLAREQKMSVGAVFRSDTNDGGAALTKDSLKGIDVCIEFTSPVAVLDNVRAVILAGKPIVVGTTGWYDRLPEISALVKKKKVGLVYAPNFSLGINLFYAMVMNAARMFDKFDAYDIAISEVHHRWKADSPSGTALTLGNIITQYVKRKHEILHETAHDGIRPSQIHISSTRVGSVVGRHTVTFDSEADTVELTHNAKNRRGFALGALIAARWVKGKKGMYTMKDVLSSL